MVWKIIVCAVLAYFLGTVQTAILLSKGVAKQDIRNFGSGNAGSTNMIRTFGWGLGMLTFFGDLAKGAITSVICNWIGGPVCVLVGGIFVILGHIWPVQHGFKGGKGVASTFGVMIGINPAVGLIVLAVCFLVAMATRIVSIASLLGVTTFFIASLFMGHWAYIVLFLVLLLMVVISHRGNISRLINGTESHFYGKNKGTLDGNKRSTEAKTTSRNLK